MIKLPVIIQNILEAHLLTTVLLFYTDIEHAHKTNICVRECGAQSHISKPSSEYE